MSQARVPADFRLPARYRVSRVIGRGGAAVVLQARDLRLEREVAVKVFSETAATPEMLIDQEREAQLLARSSHPNLVTIYDVAADRGAHDDGQHLFLVMEYVDGPDLAQWLRLQRASVLQVVELGLGLSSALQFVHQRGVLHCDIKPSNVLLQVGPDGELLPKLADFGIAAVLQGQVPQGEFTVGTAAYLSPEQVEGSPLQEASDVYALGLVLLEAATGQVAFPGSVVDSALSRLDRDPAIGDAVPTELAVILRGMTEREPAERWDLARARSAFRSLLRGDTVDRAPLPVVPDDAQQPTSAGTLPAFRTLGPDSRMPALDRAVALAARTVGADGAILLTTDHDETVLQASHGVAGAELEALVARAVAVADRTTGATPVVPVHGSRGERLGALLVSHAVLADDERQQLNDIAYLIGQVLELRAATRRALLSR